MIHTKKIDYSVDGTVFEGFYAYPEEYESGLPGILVCHDWSGKNEFACDKAKQLADLGYVGFAVDMYGKGKLGKTKEEKTALIQPLMQDRVLLQKRILAALDALRALEQVDETNIGAIGFCFGGLCALDLARSGADVKGVVSFHGLFVPPPFPDKVIKARVLALHGFDDPMVTPDQMTQFGLEMTNAKADWELDVYGNTMHGFTNPEANDPGFGTVYQPEVSKRAWRAMELFFADMFV